MSDGPISIEEMRDAESVIQGFTVTRSGMCVTRIGAEFVMRDDAGRCERMPARTTSSWMLGVAWANFCRSAKDSNVIALGSASRPLGVAYPNDVALVWQGYTISIDGFCLARVGDEFVMRDGSRRCVRIPVESVDQLTLGIAWTAFSAAVGWQVSRNEAGGGSTMAQSAK